MASPLGADARVCYARQLLLAEVGEAGQARLLASRVRASADADPHAAHVAADYLRRAGVEVVDAADASPLSLPGPEDVAALAGLPALHGAAAALAGALSAVEAIKQTLGAGEPVALPPDFTLSS